MKKQIELEAIKQQLEYALEEVHKKRSDKNLMHDWLTEALCRVKKLTMPRVINCKPERKVKKGDNFFESWDKVIKDIKL
jgi:hypothetical protein